MSFFELFTETTCLFIILVRVRNPLKPPGRPGLWEDLLTIYIEHACVRPTKIKQSQMIDSSDAVLVFG
jgi:hypothetical protein